MTNKTNKQNENSPHAEQYARAFHFFNFEQNFKLILKIFQPMAMNVQRISLTHEKLCFLHRFVLGDPYDLMECLGPLQSFTNNTICVELNLPLLSMFSFGCPANIYLFPIHPILLTLLVFNIGNFFGSTDIKF